MLEFFGGRKMFLGFLYLLSVTSLTTLVILRVPQYLLGFAPIVLAIATGVGIIVWGNVQEHRFSAQNGNGSGK